MYFIPTQDWAVTRATRAPVCTKQFAPITNRNHIASRILPKCFVDGIGGQSHDSECQNILDESFQTYTKEMGRQAPVRLAYERTNYPLSGSLAGCPGSLRTKVMSSPQRPRHLVICDRAYPCRLGQPLVVSWKLLFHRISDLITRSPIRGKAARALAPIFQNPYATDCGFYFGSRVYRENTRVLHGSGA